MKLITAEIKKILEKYPYGSQDSKGGEAVVLAKFFSPISNGTWYVLEYDKESSEDNETPYDILFGIVVGEETEYGSFSVSELEKVRLPLGLKIERDMYFGNGKTKVSEIEELKDFIA